MDNTLLRAITDARRSRIGAALCTVVNTEGSTPLKAGAKMLVMDDGRTEGTIGGGALEYAVINDARTVIAGGAATLHEHHLVRDHNMCCGGTAQVFVEPIAVPAQLIVFGAGHVNRALAQHATLLGFEIIAVDARKNILDGWSDAQATMINAHPRDAMAQLKFDAQTFIMIATHSHPLDREVLRLCFPLPRAYLGMIGSRRKAAVTRSLFIDQQWATPEEFDMVDLPAGLNINASSPHEIAISILGTMVEARSTREARLQTRNTVAASAPSPQHLCSSSQ